MNSLDPWRVIVVDGLGDVVRPVPYYGHPFYREVPSWIHYDDNDSTSRLLFDGAFIAGELKGNQNMVTPQRSGLTAAVAPIVAPATGGISVKKELDDNQVLHVEICVDGKCYRQSMDISPGINAVMQKMASWHDNVLHAQQPPPSAVVSTVQEAVGCAEKLIVGALIDRHIQTVSGSFLGDITRAVKGVAGGIASGVSATFKKLKGPIAIAASTAAAAGAAAIPGVGPIAAPIAGKLANDLVNAAAGDNKAKQVVAQASVQAKTDPAVAVALEQATKAVANATVAHHVQETAKKATQGDTTAQKQIAQVTIEAQAGDPAAKAVSDIITNAVNSALAAQKQAAVSGDNYSGECGMRSYQNISAQVKDELFSKLRSAGMTVQGSNPWFIDTHQAGVKLRAVWDQGSQYLQLSVVDRAFYASCDAIWQAIDSHLNMISSGGGQHRWLHEQPASLRHDPWLGQWYDIVGAEDPNAQARALIHSAIADAKQFNEYLRSQPQGNQVRAFVWVLDGSTGQFTQETFASVDKAIAFGLTAAQQGTNAAVGVFDRNSSRWPNPIRWTTSSNPSFAGAVAQQIARSAPSVSGWYEIVGADPNAQARALIRSAIADAKQFNEYLRGQPQGNQVRAFVWVLDGSTGQFTQETFASVDQAITFGLTAAQQGTNAAVGVFDRNSSRWPNPIRWTTNSNPAYAGAVAQQIARSAPSVSGWYEIVGQWYEIVGAALDDLRKTAHMEAAKTHGIAAGVVQTTDGKFHARGFNSLDAAVAWLQRATVVRDNFLYAAAYEKNAEGEVFQQDEEIGGSRHAVRATA